MKCTINWLHLTDLHFGQNGQGHLWPNLRAEFERDLQDLVSKYGPPDLVLFSGDLVFSGERKQFQELEIALTKLWDFFSANGSAPKLVTVPGNHDLRRPDPSRASSLALASWHQQADVRHAFWGDRKSVV